LEFSFLVCDENPLRRRRRVLVVHQLTNGPHPDFSEIRILP
jgi:hypothetical protein